MSVFNREFSESNVNVTNISPRSSIEELQEQLSHRVMYNQQPLI